MSARRTAHVGRGWRWCGQSENAAERACEKGIIIPFDAMITYRREGREQLPPKASNLVHVHPRARQRRALAHLADALWVGVGPLDALVQVKEALVDWDEVNPRLKARAHDCGVAIEREGGGRARRSPPPLGEQEARRSKGWLARGWRARRRLRQ